MKLLICDDHALFREGLEYVLAEMEPRPLLDAVANAEDALARVAETRDFNLVLLDLSLPGRSGLDALRELRLRHPDIPVAIVSAEQDPHVIQRALSAGACGFIPKAHSGEELRHALTRILAGDVYVPQEILDQPAVGQGAGDPRVHKLTGRQRELLPLLARGLTNREIAGVLGISEATVKNHVAAIFERLEISNRTEAAFLLGELEE